MGPCIFWFVVLRRLGSGGALAVSAGIGLVCLGRLSEGPLQHVKSVIVDSWNNCISADLYSRKGFQGGPFLDYPGSMQQLDPSHVRDRDKALL